MPSIPRAGYSDEDFDRGTTVEHIVGHDEWKALVPEMVAVCFEAAKRLLKPWEQILEPPLSAAYVAERIVLAPAPPEGYIARERDGLKRMQGFVLICDFCTFSKSLKWTSTHPASLAGTFDVAPAERKFVVVDLDARRVLVQPDAVDAIHREIEAFQQSTQYVAPLASAKP